MLIVKPYGRTAVRHAGRRRRARVLQPYSDPQAIRDLESFTLKHDELVIAQWISMIDKIIAKPKGNLRPTQLQRALRERLGAAAFSLITREMLLTGLPRRVRALRSRWNRKLHPYGHRVQQGPDRTAGHGLRGRWYKSFAGDADPIDLDFEALAERIRADLYDAELRIGPGSPAKRLGRIVARAASISRSVPEGADRACLDPPPWADADWQRYLGASDVAEEIKRAAIAAEQGRRPVNRRLVAPILHAHYARLFAAPGSNPLPIAAARSSESTLLDLHLEVRSAYRDLLGGRKSNAALVLPADAGQLHRLLLQRRRNKRVAALVRLGKVIHYEASSAAHHDDPAAVVEHWPADLSGSRFWTSEGQSEIKRNEAFVRVWRGTLSASARTATDWADPGARELDDILGSPVIREVAGPRFDDAAFQRKARALFGSRADLLMGAGAQDRAEVLRFALEGIASLRNAAFHFKGRSGFTKSLSRPHPEARAHVATAVEQLWRQDVRSRSARLKDAMRALHCEELLEQEEIAAIFAAISTDAPDHAPMPRFRRVLHRAETAWGHGGDRLDLPPVPNRGALRSATRLCQYGTLKLLYERAFPTWLASRDAEWLNVLVREAVERSSAAAQRINRDEHAVSRAEGKFHLGRGESIDVSRIANRARLPAIPLPNEGRLHQVSTVHPSRGSARTTPR